MTAIHLATTVVLLGIALHAQYEALRWRRRWRALRAGLYARVGHLEGGHELGRWLEASHIASHVAAMHDRGLRLSAREAELLTAVLQEPESAAVFAWTPFAHMDEFHRTLDALVTRGFLRFEPVDDRPKGFFDLHWRRYEVTERGRWAWSVCRHGGPSC